MRPLDREARASFPFLVAAGDSGDDNVGIWHPERLRFLFLVICCVTACLMLARSRLFASAAAAMFVSPRREERDSSVKLAINCIESELYRLVCCVSTVQLS